MKSQTFLLHKLTGEALKLVTQNKPEFPVELKKLLKGCTPYYEKLLTKSIRTSGEKL